MSSPKSGRKSGEDAFQLERSLVNKQDNRGNDAGNQENPPYVNKKFSKNEEIRLALIGKNDQDVSELFTNLNQENFFVDSQQFENRNSLLHEAAIAGNPKFLEEIIKKKPNFDIKNEEGDTPIISLLKACIQCVQQCDHSKCLDILLKNNANANATNEIHLSALSYATMHEDKKRQKYLKQIGIKEELVDSIDGLFYRLQDKDDETFEARLESLIRTTPGLNINELMFGNLTLLQAACKNGMAESAILLIKSSNTTFNYIDFAPIYSHKPIP